MVEPPGAVPASVLPEVDPEAASAHAAAAGIPDALLLRFGASVRQTHERANVVVLDVPPDRQQALIAALREIGIAARPPHPIQPRRQAHYRMRAQRFVRRRDRSGPDRLHQCPRHRHAGK
jgi:hypothetical protein